MTPLVKGAAGVPSWRPLSGLRRPAPTLLHSPGLQAAQAAVPLLTLMLMCWPQFVWPATGWAVRGGPDAVRHLDVGPTCKALYHAARIYGTGLLSKLIGVAGERGRGHNEPVMISIRAALGMLRNRKGVFSSSSRLLQKHRTFAMSTLLARPACCSTSCAMEDRFCIGDAFTLIRSPCTSNDRDVMASSLVQQCESGLRHDPDAFERACFMQLVIT